MFSLQRLFSRDDLFLDLFESCLVGVRASIGCLTGVLRGQGGSGDLAGLLAPDRPEKKVLKEVEERLVTTFVTGLEREDIESLARALGKLIKSTEKVLGRYRLVQDLLTGVDFKEQARHLDDAAAVIEEMVRELRKMPPLERIKELNDRLEATEEAADRVLDGLIRDLYHDNLPSGQFLARKDLYDLLEKLVDRCHGVGAVVSHIVLKNS